MRSENALLFLKSSGVVVWANDASCQLFRSPRELLEGQTITALLTDTEHALATLAAGSMSEGQSRIAGGGERQTLVQWKLSALPEGLGESVAVLAMSVVEEIRPVVSSGYRDVFEHAVEGLFRTSIEGHYLQVNPALAAMYGYASPERLIDELRDLNTQLYVLPTRRAEFVRLMNEQGFVSDFESEVIRADGRIIWIAEYGRVVRSETGKPLYFEGSVIDITARMLAETALRQSEEKYRHLVEMTSVVPWEADLDSSMFTYVGPQAVDFLGYPVMQWLEPGFWERVVHDDDRVWVTIVRGEAIEKRQRFECEYRLIRADGQMVWVREIVNILPGKRGRTMLGGFMLDVTYRREAEESLRESQHFIEQIAAASPTIFYLYDPHRRQCIYIGGRVPDILGYSNEAVSEMQPLFLLSLAHPDEVEGHEEYFEKLKTGEKSAVLERQFRLRNAEGGWVWLHSRECVFKHDPLTGGLRIIGTIEDITLQRQTIEELETNERTFRRLAETTGAVPFDFDLSMQRFTYVGPQAENLFGYPMRRWYGAEFWTAFVHPQDLEEGTRFMKVLECRPDTDYQTEFRVQTADGKTPWIRQIVHRADDEDHHQHVRGFFFDVTEARQGEEEREKSRLQLRELAARNQEVREEERVNIAREIHDELGQALTLLSMDLSWLEHRVEKVVETEARAPLTEKIHVMAASVKSTLQTVRRILSALRPPLLDELGLKDAIEWHTQEFSKRAGIRYELNAGEVSSLSPAASTAIFRIFQEILTNVARHAKASRLKVMLHESQTGFVMRIEDNGVGISEERQLHSKKFGLLGMRERAWSVGGELEIVGAPQQGTAVTLRIPSRPAPVETITGAAE